MARCDLVWPSSGKPTWVSNWIDSKPECRWKHEGVCEVFFDALWLCRITSAAYVKIDGVLDTVTHLPPSTTVSASLCIFYTTVDTVPPLNVKTSQLPLFDSRWENTQWRTGEKSTIRHTQKCQYLKTWQLFLERSRRGGLLGDAMIDWVVDTNAAESKYMSVLIQSPLDFILMWLQIGFLLLALRWFSFQSPP